MKFLFKGEAKNAVSNLVLTNENYKIAVNTLKERFGDITILIEALESELFSLPASTDKSLSLKNIVDRIEKIFRQLESMREDTNNSIMTSLIKSKLHGNFLMEITEEEKASAKKWSTIELRKALIGMVNVRESVFQSTKHFNISQTSNHSLNSQGEKNQKYEKFRIMNILEDLIG